MTLLDLGGGARVSVPEDRAARLCRCQLAAQEHATVLALIAMIRQHDPEMSLAAIVAACTTPQPNDGGVHHA